MTAKLSLSSQNPKAVIAALALLILVWIVGPHTFKHHGDFTATTGDEFAPATAEESYWTKKKPSSSQSRPQVKHNEDDDNDLDTFDDENTRQGPAADLALSFSQAEKFCASHHLTAYNATAEIVREESKWPKGKPPPQRRIYDLLLVTPSTSADMLELRLASMQKYVDYFILLEAPSILPFTDTKSEKSPPVSVDAPSVLDEIWSTRLASYHPQLIRHALSQHSHDFKAGLDHAATSRNALYTRVIPLLTGAQRVQPGDALLVGNAEEILRPVALKLVRNCAIPERTTLRTRKYWYSFEWMKIDGGGVTPGMDKEEEGQKDKEAEIAKPASGSEWWMHPQATVYRGAETVLPEELRRQREADQYVFGDAGWTCYLCYGTIKETLARMGEAGVIWYDGPKWKAAGRVVHRVMEGIDMYGRTNLSHIDENPDTPPKAARYPYMLTRDAPGAAFSDFESNDLGAYLAKKKEIDTQPDFETTHPDREFNVDNTGEPIAPVTAWRGAGQEDPLPEAAGGTGLSEEDRTRLAEIKAKNGGLSPEEVRSLDG